MSIINDVTASKHHMVLFGAVISSYTVLDRGERHGRVIAVSFDPSTIRGTYRRPGGIQTPISDAGECNLLLTQRHGTRRAHRAAVDQLTTWAEDATELALLQTPGKLRIVRFHTPSERLTLPSSDVDLYVVCPKRPEGST
jgi:hypothetical protein